MRLVPPSVRGSWRRPSRGVVITATALGIAAVLVAWATLFGPWGDGRSDESGGSGKDGGRGASGTADSAARTGPAGTIGDARTADPCTLLNPASLSRFGETVLDPDYGESIDAMSCYRAKAAMTSPTSRSTSAPIRRSRVATCPPEGSAM